MSGKTRYFMPALLAVLIVIAVLTAKTFVEFIPAQEELPTPQPTGYFVKVERLLIPQDITESPIGTFVVYAQDGKTEIWRENVHLPTYQDDTQLRLAICRWADPYIARWERQQALDILSKTSMIIGQKLAHDR